MQTSLAPGARGHHHDGGCCGTVIAAEDDDLLVEIAAGRRDPDPRPAVARVIDDAEHVDAADEDAAADRRPSRSTDSGERVELAERSADGEQDVREPSVRPGRRQLRPLAGRIDDRGTDRPAPGRPWRTLIALLALIVVLGG